MIDLDSLPLKKLKVLCILNVDTRVVSRRRRG